MATENEQTLLGVVLVALAAILLMSGLGIFRMTGAQSFIFSQGLDVLIAFLALGFGLFHVFGRKG
jgi:uncharacterized membrane protein YphA (DoxX/SURF4 family)